MLSVLLTEVFPLLSGVSLFEKIIAKNPIPMAPERLKQVLQHPHPSAKACYLSKQDHTEAGHCARPERLQRASEPLA